MISRNGKKNKHKSKVNNIMEFDFDTVPNRRASDSAKWNNFGEDILPMWVADMDFRSPKPVIEALRKHIDHGIFGYSLPPNKLKESIVDWVAKRHSWQISPDDLVFIPGVVTGFNLAAHAVTRPGDGYLVQTPTYGPFFGVEENAHLIQNEMELMQDDHGQYQIDMSTFSSAMTSRTRIFMLCNPQNPTGRVFHKEELESMAEICMKNDTIICSDEIHSDLVFSGNKHIPIASLDPEIAEKTITLIAPSKTFNIAGLKGSVAIITNEQLRKQYDTARKGLTGSVNLLAMVAMKAAYAEGENWLDALLEYLENNRDYLAKFVDEELPGVNMASPEGTYLAWLDCRDVKIDGKLDEFFKENAKVAMNDGTWFGKGGEGFVRLNFGCPRLTLINGLNRMKEAILR
jgi:cystathionine beta-lyase